MDPNLLSMIWWAVPALAGFVLMASMTAGAVWCMVRRSIDEPTVWAMLALFAVSHAVAWPCYMEAHAYGRLWCGAEPEPVAAKAEVVR